MYLCKAVFCVNGNFYLYCTTEVLVYQTFSVCINSEALDKEGLVLLACISTSLLSLWLWEGLGLREQEMGHER